MAKTSPAVASKTAESQHNMAAMAALSGVALLAWIWFSIGKITAWATHAGYFSTHGPVMVIPHATPVGTGPTLSTIAAVLAAAAAGAAATSLGMRMAAPIQHDPDDRRPLPPVGAPVTAVAGLIITVVIVAATPMLASIGLLPGALPLLLALIVAIPPVDWLFEKLRDQRERARHVNEVEWALYRYLGFDELPRHRLVAITEWDADTDDGQPGKPKTLTLAYRGHREDLKPQLAQRLDDALGAHYTLSYSTVDHLITATLASLTNEPPAIRGLRDQIATAEMFGTGATITELKYSETGEVVRFTVHHQIGAKLAGTDRLDRIARKVSDLGLPGRWRCTNNDNLAGTATFGLRPDLPTRIYPPLQPPAMTVAQAAANYGDAYIPLAVDEEGNVIKWHLKINPHMLLMGPTGTGKTATIHNAVVGGSRLGARIFIIDFKGGEFTSYRDYPNVVAVITEPYEAVALVATLYREMQTRYNLYKRDRRALVDKEPFLIIFDEYTEFQDNIKTFYANTKGKGAPRDCPTLTQFSSLLRLGRTGRLHCVAALQRADQKFLEGEAKDNFTQRLSLGKLSTQAAIMIHNDAHAGRTVPLGIRGRGTALNAAGWPTEVQAYYVPDPSEPADDTEAQIVAELRPPVSLYERGIVQPPGSDPALQPVDFLEYQALHLLKASDYPHFDPTSPTYQPPAWLDGGDPGTDSIFGPPPVGGAAVTVQELVDSYTDTDEHIRHVPVSDLEVGDYVCDPETGTWWILDEEPAEGEDEPDMTVLLLRDIYTGDREVITVDNDATLDIRELAENHVTPT